MDWFDMNIFGYGLNMSMDWFTACSPIEFPWDIFRVSGEDFPLNQYIDKLGCSWMFEQVEMNVFFHEIKNMFDKIPYYPPNPLVTQHVPIIPKLAIEPWRNSSWAEPWRKIVAINVMEHSNLKWIGTWGYPHDKTETSICMIMWEDNVSEWFFSWG